MGKKIIPFRGGIIGNKSKAEPEAKPAFLPQRMADRAIEKAEAIGARLIAQHWMNCLGEMGKDCAAPDFLQRLEVSVHKVMAKGRSPLGPRPFEVRNFNKPIRRVPLDKNNTLIMRYKAGFESWTNEEQNAHKVVFPPFDPKEWMSKPRHATHYRFFQVIGGLCDFHYNPEADQYVPVRPDLLELNSLAYSELLTISGEVVNDIEIADVLPTFPMMDHQCEVIIGVGIEFLHHGKGKLVPRVEMRVMNVV